MQPTPQEPQKYTDHPAGLSAEDIEYAGHPEDKPIPIVVEDTATPQAVPKKAFSPDKAKKVLIIVIASVVLLTIVGTLLAVMMQPKKAVKQTKTATKEEKLEPILASDTVRRINLYFKGTAASATTPTTPIKSEGYNYYSVITDTAVMSSVSKAVKPAEASTESQLIDTMLTYQKFTKRELSDGKGDNNYLADYIRPDVTCQSTILKTLVTVGGVQKVDPQANQTVEVKCIDNTKYAELSAVQKPFYDTFSAQSAVTGLTAMIGMPNITPSSVANYNRGELRYGSVANDRLLTSGDVALYYQMPNQLWKFFKSKQNQLFDCKLYSNDDLKSAYANQPCLNTTKTPAFNDTVKPPKVKK